MGYVNVTIWPGSWGDCLQYGDDWISRGCHGSLLSRPDGHVHVPMIGNYGVSETRRESNSVHSRGVIVREAKNTHSNQSSEEAWVDWLERKGVVGVGGVDTRALTRRIRDQGAMNGAIAGGEDISVEEILEEVRSHPSLLGRDLAGEVSSPEVRVEGPKTAEHHV